MRQFRVSVIPLLILTLLAGNPVLAGRGSGGIPEVFVPNDGQPDSLAPTAGAYLHIPSLGINSPIVEFPIVPDPDAGAIWYIAPDERYVGHLEGTTLPGQEGNIALGAHSEYANGSPGLFASLNDLNQGDEIMLSVGGVPKHYIVTQKFTVPFTDVSVVRPTDTNRLTLFTCTSYSPAQGIYLDRLVVVAEAAE